MQRIKPNCMLIINGNLDKILAWEKKLHNTSSPKQKKQ